MLTHTNAKGAPYGAILATGAWTIALITVMSSFATLVNYLSAAMWLFYGLVGVAVNGCRPGGPESSGLPARGAQGVQGRPAPDHARPHRQGCATLCC